MKSYGWVVNGVGFQGWANLFLELTKSLSFVMLSPIYITDKRLRMKTRVPFKEGLIEEVSGRWVLKGCKCRQCGKIIYPIRNVCLNCLNRDMERIELSQNGKLYSFTIVHMPSEHFQPPYAIGWIELPEGIRIFSQIRGWQEHPLKIGMDMKLSIEKLWDEGEKEVIGYTFRPSIDKGGT